MWKKLLFGGAGGATPLVDFGMLLLRLIAGVSLAWNHGFAKLHDPSKIIGGAEKLGMPLPTVAGWAAALSEGVFALLMAIGLMTRPSAFLVAFTMGVAAFVAHGSDDFKTREPALMFMGAAILFLLAGPGRYSIDRYLAKGGGKTRAPKAEGK